MREEPTKAEDVLWKALQSLRPRIDMRRQVPARGRYITDFSHPYLKLIVEVDGGYHFTPEQRSRDEFREWRLTHGPKGNENGWSVMRFTNHEVLADPHGVVNQIIERLYEIALATRRKSSRRPKYDQIMDAVMAHGKRLELNRANLAS